MDDVVSSFSDSSDDEPLQPVVPVPTAPSRAPATRAPVTEVVATRTAITESTKRVVPEAPQRAMKPDKSQIVGLEPSRLSRKTARDYPRHTSEYQRKRASKEGSGSSDGSDCGSSSDSDFVGRPKGKRRLEEFRDEPSIARPTVAADASSVLPDFFAALIKNVDRTVTPQHVQGIFQHFGLIASEEPERVIDTTVGVPKEEIQIRFSNPSDLELAIQHMSGGLINGRKVVLERITRPLMPFHGSSA